MMKPEVVRRSSRIQGTEKSRGFRLELRELGVWRPSAIGLQYETKGARRLGCSGCENRARRPQTGTEGGQPFQAETVGAGRLQAGMERVRRSRLRRKEHSRDFRD